MERRDALITGVVLGALCLVIAGMFLSARSDDRPAITAEASPPSPETDDLGPVDDDFEAFVDEAMAFVEASRDRRFVTEPVVVALDEAQFVARVRADLDADFAADPDEIETFNAAYRSMGLIGPDESVDEVYSRFGEAGILGFYDPVTDELVVRQRDELSLLTKSTIVHELTHAFDDQHFDLDRPEYDDRTDEIGWGFRAVQEGSASWVEGEWEATLTPDQQADLFQEELSFADPGIFDDFELSFLLLELSPYEYGEPFVEHLVDGGGNDALDDALEDPPITSEQVIFPDRYDADEGPIVIAPPPAEGEVHFTGLGGQVLIDSLFAGAGVAREFEWGGDQVVVFTEGGRDCFRWDVQAEDGTTDGVEASFSAWGESLGATDVAPIDDRTVRIERCVSR